MDCSSKTITVNDSDVMSDLDILIENVDNCYMLYETIELEVDIALCNTIITVLAGCFDFATIAVTVASEATRLSAQFVARAVALHIYESDAEEAFNNIYEFYKREGNIYEFYKG